MYVVAIQFGNGTQDVNCSCHKQSTGLQRLNCLNAFSHIYCQHYTSMVIGGALIPLNLINVAGDGQKPRQTHWPYAILELVNLTDLYKVWN